MNVWALMAETDLLENPSKRAPAGKSWNGSTSMTVEHRMMLLTWFLYTLALAKVGQVRVDDEDVFKANLGAGAREAWSFASNFEYASHLFTSY